MNFSKEKNGYHDFESKTFFMKNINVDNDDP